MIRPRSIIVIALIAMFIWIIAIPPKNLQYVKSNVASLASPILRIASSSLRYFERISRLPYTDTEKIELKTRLGELERKLAESEEALLENARLRALLGFTQKATEYSMPAAVIGKDPNLWTSIIFIDKGLESGIVRDMIVISGHGLVGRVREAGKSISKVMLINDIDSKVGAVVQKNREQGLLIGTARGWCKLIYLSLDSEISAGDRVLTSGLGGIYPKGILIGRVSKVEKEKGRLYKYAIVEPSSDLSKLEEVLCIK